jgi:hypothetical protein
MATIDQIRTAMHSVPFEPFRLRLVDGRSFLIRHPDFIAVAANPRRRDFTIHDADGPHYLDLTLVVEIHPEPSPGQTGS